MDALRMTTRPRKKVEVFRTDIATLEQAQKLERLLLERFPQLRISFDLEDRDRILRIVHERPLDIDQITGITGRLKITAEVLDR